MNTLIFTAPAGEDLSPGINIAELDEGRGISIAVEDKGHSHHLLIADQGPQKMSMGRLEGYGEILWIKYNAAGEALAGGAVSGTHLVWRGQTLARADQPAYLTWSKP
jgi:hypothetical protein